MKCTFVAGPNPPETALAEISIVPLPGFAARGAGIDSKGVNGGVRLSAVDYFVPYATWPHAEPPTLLGVPFVPEEAFQAYVLHIWAFWPNPDSIFENYNRDVPLCP